MVIISSILYPALRRGKLVQNKYIPCSARQAWMYPREARFASETNIFLENRD